MTDDPETPKNIPMPGEAIWRNYWRRPTSRVGWLAVGLSVAFYVLFFIFFIIVVYFRDPLASWLIFVSSSGVVVPIYLAVMVLCGMLGGILAVVAMLGSNDLTWLVGTALFPMFMILFYFLGLLLAQFSS
jgi:hypothetical protein